MTELLGVASALVLVGSVLGGTAAAGTRYAVDAIGPLGLAMLRYTIGALCLLPFALHAVRKLADRRETLATVGLGALFFALYPYLFAFRWLTPRRRGDLWLW